LLLQNYPNPFNPETWIPYQLSEGGAVTFSIYGSSGRLIRTLPLGFQPVGFYRNRGRAAYWDGRNNQGERVSSGVYFYQLSTPSFRQMKRMVIVK
jgi:flagellar hook assembly protein FlgD